jgi:hypothetical protein
VIRNMEADAIGGRGGALSVSGCGGSSAAISDGLLA